MRKVELPLAKGRRRDSKKPSLMVKKDGMSLEKQHRRAVTSFPFREGFLSPVRGTERGVKTIEGMFSKKSFWLKILQMSAMKV